MIRQTPFRTISDQMNLEERYSRNIRNLFRRNADRQLVDEAYEVGTTRDSTRRRNNIQLPVEATRNNSNISQTSTTPVAPPRSNADQQLLAEATSDDHNISLVARTMRSRNQSSLSRPKLFGLLPGSSTSSEARRQSRNLPRTDASIPPQEPSTSRPRQPSPDMYSFEDLFGTAPNIPSTSTAPTRPLRPLTRREINWPIRKYREQGPGPTYWAHLIDPNLEAENISHLPILPTHLKNIPPGLYRCDIKGTEYAIYLEDIKIKIDYITHEEMIELLVKPVPKTREDFKKNLQDQSVGEELFIKNFTNGEHLLVNPQVKLHIWKDGHECMKHIESHDGVHLIKNKDGLGMKVPENLDFDTLGNYIDLENTCPMINSRTQDPEPMTISQLLEKFKEVKRSAIWNMLSLEFAQTEDRLREAFEVPSFVKKHSMIRRLESVLNEKLEEALKKLSESKSRSTKKSLKEEIDRIRKQIDEMPRYQKFLLLSMAEAFTDAHVDFSATSVYYHVLKGMKIFYVAPPTPENIALYKQFESHQNVEKEWIGDSLFHEWQRIEIKEGETAMIPSGYIHFVYTPKDSIVIGGNFMLTKFAARQFEMTKLEEHCVSRGYLKKANLLSGFRNVMWAFVEHCLIADLLNSTTPDLLDLAKIFVEELKSAQAVKDGSDEWYTAAQKRELHKNLMELWKASEQPGGQKRGQASEEAPAKRTKKE